MKKIWYIGNSFKSAAPEFIMLVKTDNAGTSGSNEFTIPTSGGGYNYNIETIEHNLTNQTGNVTLTFSVAGTYQIKISGLFPRISFTTGTDGLKLLEVQNWGNLVWTSFNSAFRICQNMKITATDVPNLTNVTSFLSCFRDLTLFEDLGGRMKDWNVSNVTDFQFCFQDSPIFNADLSNWNVSNVINMQNMFIRCSAFNQNLSNWSLRTTGIGINFCSQIFRQSGVSTANYTDSLVGMINNAVNNGNLPINANFTGQNGMTFDRARSGGSNFANAGLARDFAINTLGWSITNDTVIN